MKNSINHNSTQKNDDDFGVLYTVESISNFKRGKKTTIMMMMMKIMKMMKTYKLSDGVKSKIEFK